MPAYLRIECVRRVRLCWSLSLRLSSRLEVLLLEVPKEELDVVQRHLPEQKGLLLPCVDARRSCVALFALILSC